MTGEIRNPAKLPADLYPAEKKFARCLATGIPCRVGNGELPEKAIESGEGANVVRGEVIRFFAYGGNEENPVLGSIVDLQGAWIQGDLNLLHAKLNFALAFWKCSFNADIQMTGTEFPALYMDGSRVSGLLMGDYMKVDGVVHLKGGFVALNSVTLCNARIGENLDCSRGEISRGERVQKAGVEFALDMQGSQIGGHVRLRETKISGGPLWLIGAKINGGLDCQSATFVQSGATSLNAHFAQVGGIVQLNGKFSADGGVFFEGAHIGGGFNCTGGHFVGGQCALSADNARIDGNVIFHKDFYSRGTVRFSNANIHGSFSCQYGKLIKGGENHEVLMMESTEIGGGMLWLDMSGDGGVVSFRSTKIGHLQDDTSWSQFRTLFEGFVYDGFIGSPTSSDFRCKWLANRPSNVGFSPLPYEQAAKALFGMGHARDAREILLEKECIRMRQEEENDGIFSPVSHDAVANVFFAMGRNRDAREILLKRERLLTERGEFPRIWRWGRKVWDALAGYGYRPWRRTFHISFWIMVFGSALFCWGEQAGRIAPHQPAALVSMKYQYGRIPAETPDETVARKFSGYPEFNPILFSVDIFVPLLNLHQEPFWYPAPDGGHQHWWGSAEDGDSSWWFLLEWWYWFQIMAGGVLTSFFLLSIARLLRPRQSPGERD